MAKAAPQIELTPEQINAITVWQAAKQALEIAKDAELKSRLVCIDTIPFNADKEEGGQTVKLGEGWKLALDRPMEYKMDTKNNQQVVECLSALFAVNPVVASELGRWEPVMSVSAYKKLSDTEKIILAPVVTIKPGTPTLELKPPTVKKE